MACAHTHIYIDICIEIYTRVCIDVYAHAHMYIHVYVSMYRHVHIHTSIDIYIYIYITCYSKLESFVIYCFMHYICHVRTPTPHAFCASPEE